MRYNKSLVLILILLLLLTLTSCRRAPEPTVEQDPLPGNDNGEPNTDPPDQEVDPEPDPDPDPEPDPGPPDTTTLAGIALGDPSEKVIQHFGRMYEETLYIEDGGYYGEDTAYWNYQNQVHFMIGLSSDEVLRIDVMDPEYETNLGTRVGQIASSVLPQYRDYYEEIVSIHTQEIVPGWFTVDNGGYLILRFTDGSDTIFGEPIPDDAVLKEMTLAYAKHFD